jgi:two-component system invasion response regulator UvrY
MNPKQIRIIIVDDHQQVRETWKLLLQQDKRFVIIAECSNGEEAIQAAKKFTPDIILMDINMQPINGLEATKEITIQMPSIGVIGMSINNQPSYARNMIQLGAKGYVTKNSSKQEMTTAIINVFNGKQYVCEEVRSKMTSNEKKQLPE